MERQKNFLSSIWIYLSLIKVSHTIFALPFSLSMLFVANKFKPITSWQVFWVILAVISARSAAMGFNRLIDYDIDSVNPRTITRELPAKKISLGWVRGSILFSAALFLVASGFLGVHCLVLAPFVIGFLLFYSYCKRFTSLSHIVLGIALALAPGGTWYAITGQFAMLPVWMMLGVLFWVAGFDIIYSMQDEKFDQAHNLFSVPATFGGVTALKISWWLHIISIVFFFIFGIEAQLGTAYFIGVSIFSAFLLSQHFLVTSEDLTKIDQAFFWRNGIASIVYFIFTMIDSGSYF